MSDHYHDPADLRLLKQMREAAQTDFDAWVNLDKIVEIKHKMVEVYKDEEEKPPAGQGLNVPALITYNNFGFDQATDTNLLTKKIHVWAARTNAQVIKVSPAEDQVTIYVEHF